MMEIKNRLFRNVRSMSGSLLKKNEVRLEWWSTNKNLGDSLAKIVFDWMLERKNIDVYSSKQRTHVLGIGSILGLAFFDATVWGSGVHSIESIKQLVENKKIVKYDIRALRGPITKNVMEKVGYDCSKVKIGDPAVLMPYIYQPKKIEKEYDVSLILHMSSSDELYSNDLHKINIQTDKYQFFIDEVVKSKKIISSSLHGIILAESYGIPAVFLGKDMQNQFMKYYDWYYSTGRYNVKLAMSIEEALSMEPMELPVLEEMQSGLIDSFPYDLFK